MTRLYWIFRWQPSLWCGWLTSTFFPSKQNTQNLVPTNRVIVVDNPLMGKLVRFWCSGCGQYHEAPIEKFNGKEDEPSIGGELKYPDDKNPDCVCSVYRGVIAWDRTSKHRLAGKSLDLQIESTWRDHIPWDEIDPAAKGTVPSSNAGRTVAGGEGV